MSPWVYLRRVHHQNVLSLPCDSNPLNKNVSFGQKKKNRTSPYYNGVRSSNEWCLYWNSLPSPFHTSPTVEQTYKVFLYVLENPGDHLNGEGHKIFRPKSSPNWPTQDEWIRSEPTRVKFRTPGFHRVILSSRDEVYKRTRSPQIGSEEMYRDRVLPLFFVPKNFTSDFDDVVVKTT